MWIIEDTRQKTGEHETKHEYWSAKSISVFRCKLPFGDYALPPKIAIDTKANMSEIAQNLTNEHRRVANEVEQANKCGCKLIFLVENHENVKELEDVKKWKNPRRFYSDKAVKGETLYKIMNTMQRHYDCEFRFCKPEDAGRIVEEILTDEYKQSKT